MTTILGNDENDPSTEIGRIGGVLRDRQGRVLVADMLSHRVLVFAPDGRVAFSFGRKGEGPGDMEAPCCLAFGPSGSSLWIRDLGNHRLSEWDLRDTAAAYQRAIRMTHTAYGYTVPVTFDASGNIIDVGTIFDSEPRGVQTRIHMTAAGAVVRRVPIPAAPAESLGARSIAVSAGRVRGERIVHQPFGPQELVAHGPGGDWARAISSRYAVRWYGADGRRKRQIQKAVVAPALSERERNLADSLLRQQLGPRPPRGARMPVPERKPPVRAIYFDTQGRLWIEHSVRDGARRVADVHAADGTLIARAEWPGDVALREGSVDSLGALGVLRDEFDLPRVAVLRWLKR